MLMDLLRDGAAATPSQPVMISPRGELTYALALAEAEAIASGLLEHGVSRLACALDDAQDVLVLVCAAAAIGAEPCVYPRGLDDHALADAAAAYGHDIVVVSAPRPEAQVKTLSIGALHSSPTSLPTGSADGPVLILTTGTTGRPKGTRHLWSRLLVAIRPDPRPGQRWLLAYNLNQFAGLQVLLHVLASRATLVVPRSGQPRDAIEAIRSHHATHASATPTFWRFLTHLLDAEAASSLPLEQITLGGEAVPDAVLRDLQRLFPSSKISQIYASSEFGSSVSVRDGQAGLPLSVLDRSEGSGVMLRIVEGELQVRSSVGMLGYLDEKGSHGAWRPSGDLVEVRDGRIQFVGRASDTINVGGVKVHPLPVEEAVCAVAGVRAARAYGRANPVSGQIVAVDVASMPKEDEVDLRERIQAACESLPPAARPRRIRFVEDVATHEHKIVRQAPGGEQ